jgi:hypothetical protein
LICVASSRAAKVDEKRRLKVNSLVVEIMAVTVKYATGLEADAEGVVPFEALTVEEVPFGALVVELEAKVPLSLDNTSAGGICVALAARHAAATAGATDARRLACTVSRCPRACPRALPPPLKRSTWLQTT